MAVEQRSLQRAEYAVARILSESEAAVETYARTLAAIGETLGWELGGVWEVAPAGDRLRCVATWRRGAAFGEFEAFSERMTFARGEGLSGRIWEAGEPWWLTEPTNDANFPRAEAARRAGLHVAFGFPQGTEQVRSRPRRRRGGSRRRLDRVGRGSRRRRRRPRLLRQGLRRRPRHRPGDERPEGLHDERTLARLEPAGTAGPQGVPGPSDGYQQLVISHQIGSANTEVAHLDLPDGWYLVSAKLYATANGSSIPATVVTCTLAVGAVNSGSAADYARGTISSDAAANSVLVAPMALEGD